MITPYELWTKRKPNLNYLRVWGYREVVRLPDSKMKTLGERDLNASLLDMLSIPRLLVPRPSLRIPNGTKDIGSSLVPEEVTKEVDLTKEFLSLRFSMKDMGKADVILGIRIKHESNGIEISQSHYIKKDVASRNKKFMMRWISSWATTLGCWPIYLQVDLTKELLSLRFSMKDMGEADVILVSTSMNTSEKLMPNNGQAVSQLGYASNPSTQHWQAILRVLNNIEDNSSTSSWVFLLGGGAISWVSKKQTCITSTTMESKFMASAAAGKEAKWLRNPILEILLWSKPITLISIRCDSIATLARSYSQMYNGKSIHLGVRNRMIHELITNRVVSIEFVRSQQNLADHLTKGLAGDFVLKSTEGMGLKSNQVAGC
nr:zinc finger, CCHC-type [Tanacetum cinerariifolium]